MLIPQYAGVGTTCPTWQTQVTSGGSISTAGTLYFSYQLQNRAGFSIPSVSGAIAYSANQKIIITIPATVSKPGWDIHYFILSAGTTSDPSTHVQIARLPGYQYGAGISPQSIKTSLPATIEISRDTHLALAPSVATLSSFPTGVNRIDGQVRWVISEAKWFEYRADSTLPTNVDVIAADIGQWVRIGGASAYVSDTRSGVGSDRDITTINPITVIPTPIYPGQSVGKVLPAWESQYWLYNNDAVALPSGTEFGIELEYNNLRSPDLLSGLFLVKFNGFVKSDGTIRAADSNGRSFSNLGAFFPWTPKTTTPFITSDDLQPGEAISISVKPYFSVADLNNQITPGSTIAVLPSIRVQSGDYNPLGKLLPKGAVFNIADRYRVAPNSGLSFDILSGCAIVGGYDFPQKPRRTISGLSANTSGQKIIINGNGAVFADPPSYTPDASEAIRAVVGTTAGESAPGSWSAYASISGGMTLTLTYPCNSNGKGNVRLDYPDVIASSSEGVFNPPLVNIYLQRQDTGEIRKFANFGVVASATQRFTISDWSSGAVVSSLPVSASSLYLYAPGAVAIASAFGNFPVTSYRACYSFVYNGNQITSISHASPPCIPEWQSDFQPPTVTVGTTTTLDPTNPAAVNNSGSGSSTILNFGIPRGAAATIAVGATTTGSAGSSASVTNSGTSSAAIFNFTIPTGAQGPAGATGATGAKGDTGATGSPGAAGTAATVAVGTTATGAAGSSANVTNSGTSSAAVFNFTIPTGAQGSAGATGATGAAGTAATIAVGTTTTGSAGSSANVTNSGTSSAAIFNFTIPTGAQGPAGIAGSVSSAGALLLEDASSSTPVTSSTQVAIWNNSGNIAFRAANNGEIREVGDRTVPAKLYLLSILS